MLKSVFYPSKTNSYAWVNVFAIITLVAIGRVEAYSVLFGYFLETIFIGVFNIVKMYYSYKFYDKKNSIVASILFFIVHYGGFIAIQSIFLFAIFSTGNNSFIKEPFNIIENFRIVLNLEGMPIILTLLIGTQFMKFFFDFLIPRKYEKFKVKEIMFKPYFRIIIQQFTVIIASFFMVFPTASILAAMLLIFLRFVVDFILVAIKEDSRVLDYIANKVDDGKVDKKELRKQILLFTE